MKAKNTNFIDYVKIFCRSGKGGAGSTHFHRSKTTSKGGPDGGDGGNGGKGGDVFIKGTKSLNTLVDYRFQKHFKAKKGRHGSGRNRTGAAGQDVMLKLPLGTEIFIEDEVNIILLTQGLPDHCHIPSLKKFPKNIDIICSSSAKEILEKSGFTSIKVLKPSEKIIKDDLEIEATAGAPVPQIENGYIVKYQEGKGFYIEPHGYLDGNLKSQEIDVVITPTINLGLPLLGSFVKGADVLPKLIDTFNPRYILSSTAGGEAKYSGLLNKFISKVLFIGCLRESDSIKTLNLSLSSARSIESGDVPIILTPHSSSSLASLRGVCPPY